MGLMVLGQTEKWISSLHSRKRNSRRKGLSYCGIGKLGILRGLYGEITIPTAVYREVTAMEDSACMQVRNAGSWIHVESIRDNTEKKMYKANLCWRDVDLEQGILAIEKSRSVVKNRAGGEESDKYVLVAGSTKNEKARKIALTAEALKVLKTIWLMQSDHDADSLIVRTRTGKGNTATNLEHRMTTVFRNAGLSDLSQGLHIYRRTFAARQYEKGIRTKEIAAYIGDLESTTEKYYIAVRKKRVVEGQGNPVRTYEGGAVPVKGE